MSGTTSADVGTDSTTPIISVRPVTLAASNRGQDNDAWPTARGTLTATSDALGRIDSK